MIIYILSQDGDQVILCASIEAANDVIAECGGQVHVLPWDTDEPYCTIYVEPKE